MSKKVFLILLGGALSSFFVGQNLMAYDQHNTHPALTSEAVNFYNLNFSNNLISEKEKQLLIKGAVEEDFLPKPFNHFYDPVYNRGWAGFRSSKVWARSSAQQQETRSLLALNPWSMQKSSEEWPADFSYERALLDYAKGNRERAFEAFGHVMHLLEDANVPEHTRNDTHADIGHNTGSPYEKVMAKWNPGNFKVAGQLFRAGKKPVLFNNLDNYFDSIAKYSNGYFFSEDTIETNNFNSPKVKRIRRFNLENGKSAFVGVGLDKHGKEFDLVFISSNKVQRNFIESKKATLANGEIGTQILDGYWDRLSKDFVLHGAGALKMFLDQAEEFKKEYEKQQAAKNENKKSFASIFGFGAQKNGIAMAREFLADTEARPFSSLKVEPLSGENPKLDINAPATTEVKLLPTDLTTTEVGPRLEETPKTIEVNPQLSQLEQNIVPAPTAEPNSLPVASPSPTPSFSSVNNLLAIVNGGGGGNQTAQPTPTPIPEVSSVPTLTPTPTPEDGAKRKVVINEIAWMGTATSSNDEWLELYNTSSLSMNLTGWTLKAKDGTPDIALLPISIGPFGFYLLERTANTTVSDMAADQIYTGALGNTGEILELRDGGGYLQDIVSKSASGGWYAGSNSGKFSMERISPLAKGDDSANWGTNNGVLKNGLDVGGGVINGTPHSKNSIFSGQKPSKINNLAVSSSSGQKINFSWSAPSDKDTLPSNLRYDFRYATKSFETTDDWNNAKVDFQGLTLAVDNFGKTATLSLTIDDFNKTYYFAIKTKDADNNFSDISNQVNYLLLEAVSGLGWPMSGLNSKHSLKTEFLGPAGPSVAGKWAVQFWSSPPTNFSQPVVAPNGTIYFGLSNGNAVSQLWAIAPNGSEKWQYFTTAGATIGTPVTMSDNSVLFGYSNNGTEFTKISGTGTAQYTKIIGAIYSVTVDKNGTSYFTSSGDKLVAVAYNGSEKWAIQKDGIFGLTPTVLDDGKIYLTGRVSNVPIFYAFDASNGNFLLSKTMSTGSSTCCGVSDVSYDAANDFLYAGADQYILKIDRNGNTLEQFPADRQVGWGFTTTMISQDTNNLIFGLDFSINNPASKSAVYAINKNTKEITWKYSVDAKINKQIAIDSGGNSYFSTKNGWVYSLNQNGVLNWKIDLSGTTSAYPVIGSGVLYIAMDAGRLVKIGE